MEGIDRSDPAVWHDLGDVAAVDVHGGGIGGGGGGFDDDSSASRAAGAIGYGQGITLNTPLVFRFDYWDLWGFVWTELTGPAIPNSRKLANMADPAVRDKPTNVRSGLLLRHGR